MYANPAAMNELGPGPIQGIDVAEFAAKLGVLRADGSPRPVEEAPPLRALRGEVIRNEEQIVRSPRTGEPRRRQVSSAPVRDAQGTIIGSVSVARDVTESHAREERLRQVEREHAELLDISSDPIFVWELDGVIQYWNRGAEELYGYSSREAVGRVSHDLLATTCPEGMSHTLEELRRAGSWRGELNHRTKDGSVLAVQTLMQVVRRGNQLLVLESNRDLTAQKQNENLLREADRRKDEFIAMLSHELRNPLAPIRNVAAYLNLPNVEEKRLEWARQVLHRQVTHMSQILDDLLDVTRITRGQLALKRRLTRLDEIVEAAIDTARPLIDKNGHHLAVDLPREVIRLNGDPVRLSQVLSNLLTNAAKYTDRGGLIQLAGRVDGAFLRLSVKDNGVGIAPDHIPQLFTMFSQLEGTRERSESGLGIGLALARNIVELHGGTIEVRSAGPGTGTEVEVLLPLLESNPAATHGPDGAGRVETDPDATPW
jgi:PAS domain S-box-containing protein